MSAPPVLQLPARDALAALFAHIRVDGDVLDHKVPAPAAHDRQTTWLPPRNGRCRPPRPAIARRLHRHVRIDEVIYDWPATARGFEADAPASILVELGAAFAEAVLALFPLHAVQTVPFEADEFGVRDARVGREQLRVEDPGRFHARKLLRLGRRVEELLSRGGVHGQVVDGFVGGADGGGGLACG